MTSGDLVQHKQSFPPKLQAEEEVKCWCYRQFFICVSQDQPPAGNKEQNNVPAGASNPDESLPQLTTPESIIKMRSAERIVLKRCVIKKTVEPSKLF